ncbi:hypothetical protein QUB11_03310 [Microcoleus sp. B6-A1]|uniref:hypothetical protein n=1 Tax=Microcoleus sp. B6-A1 TaxID=2818684 RepID=UPI002FD3B7DC
MKKALPLINPGAGDEQSQLFSRFTDESGGPGRHCLIVKLVGETETAIGYNKELEEKNTENPKIWLPSKEISTLPR